jgi:hypothetical protein
MARIAAGKGEILALAVMPGLRRRGHCRRTAAPGMDAVVCCRELGKGSLEVAPGRRGSESSTNAT